MIWDNKTAFFQVQLPNTKTLSSQKDFTNLIRPQDVKSLTITEEFGQITSGSLSLRDPHCNYPRIIPRGAYINVSWGYKRWDQTLNFLDPGLDVAKQGIVRRGFIGLLQAPSGGGDTGGETTYNASFVMANARGQKRNRTFEGGKKSEIVALIFADMGILAPEINFARGSEVFDGGGYELQSETDFKTLARWAGEWGCAFRLGHLSDGSLSGVFIDWNRVKDSPTLLSFAQVGSAGIDSINKLVYRAGKDYDVAPNMLSYEWQHQDGVNGSGDGVILYLAPDGTTQKMNYHVADETVQAWKLNMTKVQDFVNGGDRDALAFGATSSERVARILAAPSFSSNIIKRLFDPIELKTAPNGVGYSVTAKLLGTPYLTPGLTANFYGSGFPDFLTPPGVNPLGNSVPNSIFFYHNKVTHTLSSAGYFTNTEIVDTYSQSPTGTSLVAAGG